MGCSSEDDDAVESAAATGKLQTDSSDEFVVKVSRNRFKLLSSDNDGCSEQFISKRSIINADIAPEFDQSGGELLDFVDSRFGEILPLVLEHAVLQDFSVLMFSKSRSWAVGQPSAKKVIKQVFADRELRTPVKVIETLAKLVPFVVELIRVGVSLELLAVELAADHGDEELFQDFYFFDHEVAVAAGLDLEVVIMKS
jgi:hypothetical protein